MGDDGWVEIMSHVQGFAKEGIAVVSCLGRSMKDIFFWFGDLDHLSPCASCS